MDGLSVLYPATQPSPLYNIGNAHGWLAKSSKTAGAEYHLSGRLYLAKSGWLLLAVPNALVRGVFDAMSHAGAELPLAGTMNVPNVDKELLNAHISVMTAEEVEKIGANKINERGHSFRYSLGAIKEITPTSASNISKAWAIQVSSPELSALRKSYGLSALPNGDHQFHITVAVRRKNVLRENTVSKFDAAAGRGELKAAAENKTTYECNCSGRCTCPPSCICKKSCRAEEKFAHEGAPWGTPPDKLPWRERVEVYAHDPKGRIYGGIWNTDKSFAVPGGGIDAAGRLAALQHIIANIAKKTSDKTANNFLTQKQATRIADEHKHTSNDKVTEEIADNCLQKSAERSEKEELNSVRKTPQIILQLRAAKEHSDNKRYDQKNQILKKLMAEAPHEWVVDDPAPYHMGITHAPTKFKFHADPLIIPPVVPVQSKAAANPYLTHLTQTPIKYDRNQSLWQNVMAHVRNVKARGDNQIALDKNTESWRATLVPGYRERMNLAIARGQYPKQDFVTSFIHDRGDSVLNALSR